jgi:Fic family protein
MKFLDGLSDDLKKNLLKGLRVLWTHASTSIEGNTLTLGETDFVLSEGLTIKGKPLKDHRDVEGHARAVDLLLNLVKKDTFTAEDLFDLHRLVINEQILDFYKPSGGWKNENSFTTITLGDTPRIFQFSNYLEVPQLMARWLDLLKREVRAPKEPKEALKSFARLHVSFVGIHPFWDGNGRMARLVSNLPCLKSGYPPIIIENDWRYDYITALAEYHLANGVPTAKTDLVFDNPSLEKFQAVCEQSWAKSWTLVDEARALQKKQNTHAPKISTSPGGKFSP